MERLGPNEMPITLKIEKRTLSVQLASIFKCTEQKLRTRAKRGVQTKRNKGGRPKAAKKEHLDDASVIIRGLIFTDDLLSTPKLHTFLRDIFAGLGTTRLQEIKSGTDVPQSGTLSIKTIDKYLKIIKTL